MFKVQWTLNKCEKAREKHPVLLEQSRVRGRMREGRGEGPRRKACDTGAAEMGGDQVRWHHSCPLLFTVQTRLF